MTRTAAEAALSAVRAVPAVVKIRKLKAVKEFKYETNYRGETKQWDIDVIEYHRRYDEKKDEALKAR